MLQPEPGDRPTAQEVFDVLRNKKVLELKSDAIKIAGEEIEVVEHSATATPTIPAGFCTPWPEHTIEFVESKLSASGYVAAEQFEKDGKKHYYIYKAGGKKSLFTIENLILLGFAKRTGGSKSIPPKSDTSAAISTTSSEIIVHNDGVLWEDDSEFKFDMEAVKRSGYEEVARAERKGLKGYVLIKPSGDRRFTTVDKLKLLRFVIAK